MSRFAMYRALLAQQWSHQKVEITALTIAAAVVCPFVLWKHDVLGSSNMASQLLDTSTEIGAFGGGVAIIAGLLLAVRPFLLDGRVRHVYALALPVRRSEYALLRAWSGLTLALVPAVGFAIGAVIAAQAAPPQPFIRAYPVAIAIRFTAAAALAFAIGFGIQYGLGQRAVRWLGLVLFTVAGAELGAQLAFQFSLALPTISLLGFEGSPLRLFLVPWTLFNV